MQDTLGKQQLSSSLLIGSLESCNALEELISRGDGLIMLLIVKVSGLMLLFSPVLAIISGVISDCTESLRERLV